METVDPPEPHVLWSVLQEVVRLTNEVQRLQEQVNCLDREVYERKRTQSTS